MTIMQRYPNESHSQGFNSPHEQLRAGGMHGVSSAASDVSASGRGERGQSVTTSCGPAEAEDLCPMSTAPLTPPDGQHPLLDEGSRAMSRHAYANARDVLPSELPRAGAAMLRRPCVYPDAELQAAPQRADLRAAQPRALGRGDRQGCWPEHAPRMADPERTCRGEMFLGLNFTVLRMHFHQCLST